ncbi:hypothetical protein RIF29_21700 [Crotalaria pallida]|uniref:Uncharacterized protein n=1 Tax=Crotalaria pallida TaxID=3830 RepID=A0AAN9F523_CROPI
MLLLPLLRLSDGSRWPWKEKYNDVFNSTCLAALKFLGHGGRRSDGESVRSVEFGESEEECELDLDDGFPNAQGEGAEAELINNNEDAEVVAEGQGVNHNENAEARGENTVEESETEETEVRPPKLKVKRKRANTNSLRTRQSQRPREKGIRINDGTQRIRGSQESHGNFVMNEEPGGYTPIESDDDGHPIEDEYLTDELDSGAENESDGELMRRPRTCPLPPPPETQNQNPVDGENVGQAAEGDVGPGAGPNVDQPAAGPVGPGAAPNVGPAAGVNAEVEAGVNDGQIAGGGEPPRLSKQVVDLVKALATTYDGNQDGTKKSRKKE